MIEIDTSNGKALLQDPMPNPGPPILFVHGFNSSSEIWLDKEGGEDGFVNIASRQGLNPWTLDLSDPTLSDVRKLAVEDLHEGVRFVFQEKKQKLRLVCHSMGGLLARIVTTQNLLPDVPEFLSTPYLEEVALLSVPNHGYGRSFSELTRIAEGLMDLFAGDTKEKFAKPFFQMLSGTSLISQLNKNPPLCPDLSWKNCVALEDLIIPPESAMFGKVETISVPYFEQRLFHASHGEWLKETSIYPAIYRHPEVADWLFSKSA
ncbi:MAG: esterase/lipase family protein [Candidatus Hodarchaeales archaeon]|jgi:hypothetical protein